MKYTTIQDIANALGISKSTVSRALRGDERNVNKDTLGKIVAKANEMNYRRNELAVNLRTRNTRTIGIVVPEMITPFYMNFITEAQNMLNHYGYRVILALSDENHETERINLLMFNDYRVEGVLISACHNKANLDTYQEFIDRKTPLVFFDRTISDICVPKIKIDDYVKSLFMVEHLIRSNKKNIIHLAGPNYIQNAIERKNGYRDALSKFKIAYDPKCVIEGGVNVEDGANAIKKVINQNIEFDAVFCFTEMQALGAKRCLQEHGLSIPDEIAISCMSGTTLSTLVHPALTAVEQPVREMARTAVRLVINKINDFSTPNETITLSSEMIIRGSTSV